VRTLPPPEALGARVVIAPEQQLEDELRAHGEARFVAYACPGDKPGRLTGVPAGPHRRAACRARLRPDAGQGGRRANALGQGAGATKSRCCRQGRDAGAGHVGARHSASRWVSASRTVSTGWPA
jgi:hypothetical protein